MKMIFATYNQEDAFYINHYGIETVSKDACWGRGVRNAYLIHYVLTGEGVFNGHKVKAGQGFLITPELLHEYHSSLDNPWQYFWITLGGIEAMEICKKHISFDENNLFSFDFKPDLLSLSLRIMEEEQPISSSKALGYFYFLMSLHEKATPSSQNHYVQDAKNYMNIHFYRNLSITEVANALYINDRYLYNLFIKYEGVSPKQYLTQLRLTSAKKC